MKQKIAVKIFLTAMMLMLSSIGFVLADDTLSDLEIENTTEFTYQGGFGDSRETAFALAAYGAKHKAVLLSARHLADRDLLRDFGDKKMAIFCLVAEDLKFSIIDESFSEKTTIYTIKIKSTVTLSNFVKAEIKNRALEKKDSHLSLKDEMDPVLSATIEPGQELAKAYRYLGTHHWRMAIIYLDRLEKKYPHWDKLFLAKALGFQGMHETRRVKEALATACDFGNNEACLKIKYLEQ